MIRCAHCGGVVERVPDAHTLVGRPTWRSVAFKTFRCAGAIHHRPDLPPPLDDRRAVESWLTS